MWIEELDRREAAARHIAATLGLPADASKVEGLRSKLKRLAERGWLHELAPGLFTLARQPSSGGGPES